MPQARSLVSGRLLDGHPGYWVVTPFTVTSTGATLPLLRAAGPHSDRPAAAHRTTHDPRLPRARRGTEPDERGRHPHLGRPSRLVNAWSGDLYNAFGFVQGRGPHHRQPPWPTSPGSRHRSRRVDSSGGMRPTPSSGGSSPPSPSICGCAWSTRHIATKVSRLWWPRPIPEGSQPLVTAAPSPTRRPEAPSPFQVMAFVVGIGLLVLVLEMILHWGFENDALSWWPQPHGFLYMLYVVATANLGFQGRLEPSQDGPCHARRLCPVPQLLGRATRRGRGGASPAPDGACD